MGQTMTEKIISRAAGQVAVRGDLVWAKVNRVSLIDSSNFPAWADFFNRNQARVWDPSRVVITFDHLYRTSANAVGPLPLIRNWARKQSIPLANVFDIGRHGLSHQVPAEAGFVVPGTVYAAADTQGPTMGAFNCFAFACLDSIPFIMATGDTWLRVPECIQVVLHGRLPKGVLGKDVYFRLMKDLAGVSEGRVIEFAGEGIASIPIDVRMAIANGAPHMGALTMVFPADSHLLNYLAPRVREAFEPAAADADAHYVQTRHYDLADFEQLVSGPNDPNLVQPLSALEGMPIQAAYIGSCSSGRLVDLALAAQVMQGRKVADGVRLVVTPISSKVQEEAAERGILAVFSKAGAAVTTPGCGACFYGNQSPLLLDEGEVCITSSVENWPGRMGSDKASIYLANAAVAAASAVEGCIANPAKYYARDGVAEGG